jgi:ribulose bisphosphate carboxylase small subunit
MTYYISPRFLNKLSVHITKNFLDLPRVRVPLILGVHGRKGEGKTFQCQLVFEKLGFEPVTISGGELESPDAGDPARLLRLRYREAAEQIRVRGKMCALFINDLDAGAGRFDSGTQYTVNTQMVNATLMNIADNPTNVQLPGSYDDTPLHRVPIIVTGNDFATLYAPLIRDGRMEKFYWEPDHADKLGIVRGIFQSDELSDEAVEKLVNTFEHQAIDFFGALRGRIYDEQILDFIQNIGIEKLGKRIVNSKEKPPEFTRPNFDLSHLMNIADTMVREQNRIHELRLVEEYNKSRLFGVNIPAMTPVVNPPVNHSDQTVSNSINNHAINNHAINNQPINNHANHSLDPAIQQQIEYIFASGYHLSLEYADPRRFKTGSWKSCGLWNNQQTGQALTDINQCLGEHQPDYVRLIGIDPQLKRRVIEQIIQKPL